VPGDHHGNGSPSRKKPPVWPSSGSVTSAITEPAPFGWAAQQIRRGRPLDSAAVTLSDISDQVVVAAVLALSGACGGGTEFRISRAQWEAVPVGATRAQVIGRLGHDPVKQTVSSNGSTWIFYDPGGGRYAGFGFDPVSARLVAKRWIDLFGTSSIARAPTTG
jgi:hypothetical protein